VWLPLALNDDQRSALLTGRGMLGLLIALCAVFGLAIGSFLNVVIYRVPKNESIVSPRSSCPACGALIRERDNIPVLSWLLLRGHCRDCQTAISARYPLVELACAGLFAGTAARFGYQWDLPAFLVLFAGLLALSCIDIEQMILPKKIVYPLTLLVALLLLLAAAETGHWHDYFIGLLCVVFFAMNLASPRLLGFGDVRLALVLGLALGWLGIGYVLLGFFSANLIGAVVGIILIATKKIDRQSRMPYGIYLALGCAVAVFAGPELLRPFHTSF
jgi:leader peptidase (prepilin peptidase) / N-methyltransferase